MGLAGVLLGLALLVWLAFRGWSVLLLAPLVLRERVRRGDRHVEYELDTATWLGPYAGTATPFEVVQEIEQLLLDAELAAACMSINAVKGVEIGDGDRSAISDAINALMGSKPEARFRFIQERAAFAQDLDI